MTKKRKIAYGLLLTVATLLLSLALLPGQAYARYDTAIYWNMVVNGIKDPAIAGPEDPVITMDNKTLEFTLSEGVKDPTFTVEVLSSDQTYTPVIVEGMMISQAGNTVKLQIAELLLPAGTYRLVINWKIEETAETKTAAATFFINYSDAKAQEVTE